MATTVTHTIKSSGGDYTTLSAWEAAQQRNLVTADEIEVAECYDFDCSDNVGVAGWTTDATRYIKIVSPAAERHNGTSRAVSGTGFRLTSTATDATMRIAQSYVYLEGLDVENTGTGRAVQVLSGAGVLDVKESLFHDAATGTDYTFSALLTGMVFTMRNSVVYGNRRSMDTRSATSATIYNSVLWRHAAQLGILGDTELVCKNVYSGHTGAAAEDFWTGGAAPSGNNNASSDTTATTDYTSSIVSKAGADQFVSVTAGSEDFHLKAGAALIGAGADLSATFTTDIDGDTWGATWDIGADYYVSAGGPTVIDLTSASLGFTANTLQNTLRGSLTAASQAFTPQDTQNRQTITPTAPSLTFTANATQNRLTSTLTAATLSFTAQAINVIEGAATFVIDLTAATFAYTAQSVQLAQSMAMSAASLAMTGGTFAMTQAVSLTAATLTFLGKAIQNRLTIGLTAAALTFTAWALDVTGAVASAVARLMMLMGVGS